LNFDSFGWFGSQGCTVLMADWQTALNEGFGPQLLAGQGLL